MTSISELGKERADPKGHEVEQYKILLDYVKQLTTLSTGSIVVIAAFVQKSFNQPKWRAVVAVSLASFMLSVLASVILHTVLLGFSPARESPSTQWEELLAAISVGVCWFFFLTGIASLSIFVIKNLF